MTDNTEREALAQRFRDHALTTHIFGKVSADDLADLVLAWMRENDYEKREPVTGVRNPFDAMDEAFRDHDAPAWGDDDVARDAAIRWHQRGFLDGVKFAAEREPVVVDDATSITWDEMWELPIGSVVLYEQRPFQKVRQLELEIEPHWQRWEGAGSASLTRDGVDRYAPAPVVVIYQPAALTPGGQETGE